MLSSNARAGVGVSVHDQSGNWLTAKAHNIGCLSALIAELFVILFGLELAWKQGYMHMVPESDSTWAIEMVLGPR